MKLFSKNRDTKEPNVRDGIYEIAKEAYRKGVENQMKSKTVLTEKVIDDYCRSLHLPEKFGRVYMNADIIHRRVFRMTLGDDTPAPIQSRDDIDNIMRGVIRFFEKEGFSVTTTYYKDSERIREATVSIREEDKVWVHNVY